jgi:mannose-1-phosphate guanylyltransferase
MRYALILAGGAGTRLWPMSRDRLPKHLLPLVGGKSLLQVAYERLEGLIAPERRYVCAGRQHVGAILDSLAGLSPGQVLDEPVGRDTLHAVGLAAAVLARQDPQAVIAVFTADHVIEPIDRFQAIIAEGFELVERRGRTLVTFGIAPTHAATGYGYLELGPPLERSARVVARFKEKPDEATARAYLAAGPERYVWNSGMFVWRAATFLECMGRYAPVSAAGLTRIAAAWGRPERLAVLDEVYPALAKVSVDYAVMEPASVDPDFQVAAVPMPLFWRDVGSWTAYAETRPHDQHGNVAAAARHVLLDTRGTLLTSSDPGHLIAAVGCEDLVIIHTPDATLVCRADRVEEVKRLCEIVAGRYGETYR